MRRDLSRPIAPAPLPTGIRVVPFDRDVAPACRELMNSAYDSGLGDVIPFAAWWPWLTTDSEFDPAYIDVAMRDSAVVGFCHGWKGNFIKDLAVDPAQRGRGLGAALVTRALERYAGAGFEVVDLKTHTDNHAAQSLYRRLGFEIVERIG